MTRHELIILRLTKRRNIAPHLNLNRCLTTWHSSSLRGDISQISHLRLFESLTADDISAVKDKIESLWNDVSNIEIN